MERLPEVSAAQRIGRFSISLQKLPDTPAAGRFSAGLEHWPQAAALLRVGTFADGCEQISRR